MINATIEKSFNNIMYQQEKMDNKSYIFLGFLGFFVTSDFFEATYNGLDNFTVYLINLIVIALIMSLIPIANKVLIRLISYISGNQQKKIDDLNNINIFYYLDIYGLSKEQFIKTLEMAYQFELGKDITKADIFLIEEILINSKILRTKVFYHEVSQGLILMILLRNIYIFFCA